MILQKEFYFVRHGQTDYNLLTNGSDHPPHIPLNATGRTQARAIEPVVASLPIKTVCFSPMKRALETKEIITERLLAEHSEIADLGECSGPVWEKMSRLRSQEALFGEEQVSNFVQRVKKGLNMALSQKGPVLIVAHGGVHWAICGLMNILSHDWAIDNCIPVHFSFSEKWVAKKLI